MTEFFSIFNGNDKPRGPKFSIASNKNMHKEKYKIGYYNQIAINHRKQKSLKSANG